MHWNTMKTSCDHLKLDGIQNLGTRIMLSQLNRKTEVDDK